jgi:hypothetical protein
MIIILLAGAVTLTGELVGAIEAVAVGTGSAGCSVGIGSCLAGGGCGLTDVGEGEDAGVAVGGGVEFKSDIGRTGSVRPGFELIAKVVTMLPLVSPQTKSKIT